MRKNRPTKKKIHPDLLTLFEKLSRPHKKDLRKTKRTRLASLFAPAILVENFNPYINPNLIDLSSGGLSLLYPFQSGMKTPEKLTPLKIQISFNHSCLINLNSKVTNSSIVSIESSNYLRLGLKVLSKGSGIRAYRSFVNFMQELSKLALPKTAHPD